MEQMNHSMQLRGVHDKHQLVDKKNSFFHIISGFSHSKFLSSESFRTREMKILKIFLKKRLTKKWDATVTLSTAAIALNMIIFLKFH